MCAHNIDVGIVDGVEHESSYVKKIANMSKHKLTHLSRRLKHTLAKLQEIRNTFTKVVEIR